MTVYGSLRARIHRLLASRARKTIPGGSLRPAAVLLPLFEKEGGVHILLTKRTQKVKTHKGEISFPGGVRDEDDETLEQTALRESFEELGIKKEDVEVLGCLDDVETLTEYMIRPFVGTFPYPYPFAVNRDEIEQIIELPLESLLQRDRFEKKVVSTEKGKRLLYTYHYGHHVIWGATAKILKQFVDLLRDTP